MSNLRLSPKYGVNPTIPVCFWCGKDRGDIALMGHIGDGRKHEDFKAPQHMVLDFEPCDRCTHSMSLGFTVIEATCHPNSVSSVEMQRGVYPTGRFVVLKKEAAIRIFQNIPCNVDKAFLDAETFTKCFGERSSLWHE